MIIKPLNCTQTRTISHRIYKNIIQIWKWSMCLYFRSFTCDKPANVETWDMPNYSAGHVRIVVKMPNPSYVYIPCLQSKQNSSLLAAACTCITHVTTGTVLYSPYYELCNILHLFVLIYIYVFLAMLDFVSRATRHGAGIRLSSVNSRFLVMDPGQFYEQLPIHIYISRPLFSFSIFKLLWIFLVNMGPYGSKNCKTLPQTPIDNPPQWIIRM